VSAKVFVGNLSFQTSKEALGELLSQAGQVVDVFLPTSAKPVVRVGESTLAGASVIARLDSQ